MDDFVINVRQIFQYPQALATGADDGLLLQVGSLGGAYNYIRPTDLMATALDHGGFIKFPADGSGGLAFNSFTLTANFNEFLFSAPVVAPEFIQNGFPCATIPFVEDLFANTVQSFNGRVGRVLLELPDILRAGGAPILNPHLLGWCTATTPLDPHLADSTIATTCWVQNAIADTLEDAGAAGGIVTSFDGRGGCVWLNDADLTFAATQPGAQPRANTPPAGDASNRIATTYFVDDGLAWLRSLLTTQIATATVPAIGTRVLIATQTVSAAVASVDFLSGIGTGTYDQYELVITDYLPATESILQLRVSTDGTTFDAAANYSYAWQQLSTAGVATAAGSAAATAANLGPAAGITARFPFYAVLRFWLSTVASGSWLWQLNLQAAAGAFTVTGMGEYNAAALGGAIKGLRLLAASGNITRGTFKLYGIKK